MLLSGGAKAANVLWQVAASATLGTTSAFVGAIMADQAITLDTGATLNGRALDRIAAILQRQQPWCSRRSRCATMRPSTARTSSSDVVGARRTRHCH